MKFKDLYNKVITSKHVFLTGEAGTGKTYNLKKIVRKMKNDNIRKALTASTGIAAFHIKGMTIHRVLGFGIHNTKEYLETLYKKDWWEKTKKTLKRIDWLIIDEISMLSPKQFELANIIMQKVRNSKELFGGCKLLMVGDFLQLPPINVKEEGHLFESNIWKLLNLTIIKLDKVRRTKEPGLIEILGKVRKGIYDTQVYEVMEDIKKQYVENPVKIMATNAEVNAYNIKKLNQLSGELKYMNAYHTLSENVDEKIAKKMILDFYNNSLVEQSYFLKIGARVMFIRNQESLNIVNGDLGIVIDFTEEDEPIVQLDRGKIVKVHKRDMKIEDVKGKVQAIVWQQPLKLAYAMTVHKTQGMTLEKIEINANNFFAPGQFYVALSRSRSIEGIKLKNFDSSVIKPDKNALEFYKNI